MTPMSLVHRVLAVELVLVAATLALILGHALWYRGVLARRTALLDAGRLQLVAVLASGTLGDFGALAAIPRRVLIRLLADIAPSLAGPHKEAIVALAERLGLTAAATRSLASRWWWRRLRGARLLTLVGRDAGALAGLHADPHPLVRAQRAESLGQHPSPEGAEELVAALRDPARLVRFAAKESLMLLGASAQAPIARALADAEGGEVLPLLEVATAIASTAFLDVALGHSHDEPTPVRVQAARLLRAIGAGSAIERLVELLGDPRPAVRVEAATAIGALGHWQGGAALARLVDDADFEVRLAAAVALQRLGAPGELLLRRARDREDGAGAGADVARQVLDVADRLRIGARG